MNHFKAFLFLFFFLQTSSLVHRWRPDYFAISTSGTQLFDDHFVKHQNIAMYDWSSWYINISIASLGKLIDNPNGNFRFLFQLSTIHGVFDGVTPCLSFGSTEKEIQSLLQNSSFHFLNSSESLSTFLSSLTIQKFQSTNQTTGIEKNSLSIIFKGNPTNLYSLNATLLTSSSCSAPIRSLRRWNDPFNWISGLVPPLNPLPSDPSSIIVESSSSLILLENDISLSSLDVRSGVEFLSSQAIEGGMGGCPHGWSPSPLTQQHRSNSIPSLEANTKCYRLFDDPPLSFDAAQAHCQAFARQGSVDASLVHIGGYPELELVKGVCRGGNMRSSAARSTGCWIGMRQKKDLLDSLHLFGSSEGGGGGLFGLTGQSPPVDLSLGLKELNDILGGRLGGAGSSPEMGRSEVEQIFPSFSDVEYFSSSIENVPREREGRGGDEISSSSSIRFMGSGLEAGLVPEDDFTFAEWQEDEEKEERFRLALQQTFDWIVPNLLTPNPSSEWTSPYFPYSLAPNPPLQKYNNHTPSSLLSMFRPSNVPLSSWNYAGFRDWRRGQPDNRTSDQGQPHTPGQDNGELCVELQAWERDPLHREQGSWNDASCSLERPFVCQAPAIRVKKQIRVLGPAFLSQVTASHVDILLSGQSNITSSTAFLEQGEESFGLRMRKSSILFLLPSSVTRISGSLLLEDGSRLEVLGSSEQTEEKGAELWVSSGVLIGETSHGLPPSPLNSEPSTHNPTPFHNGQDNNIQALLDSGVIEVDSEEIISFFSDGKEAYHSSTSILSPDSPISSLIRPQQLLPHTFTSHFYTSSSLADQHRFTLGLEPVVRLEEGASLIIPSDPTCFNLTCLALTLPPNSTTPSTILTSHPWSEFPSPPLLLHSDTLSFPWNSSSLAYSSALIGGDPIRTAYPFLQSTLDSLQGRANPSRGSKGNVTIRSRVEFAGRVVVGDGMSLSCTQGGQFSQSTVLTGLDSILSIGGDESSGEGHGGSATLASFDSFDLNLAHRGPVVGEYWDDIYRESVITGGVFRLAVLLSSDLPSFPLPIRSTAPSPSSLDVQPLVQLTKCLPFNASSLQVRNALNELSLVYDRGGVSVRRYGDGQSPRSRFGFVHRIDFDSPSTNDYSQSGGEGSLEVLIGCYGIEGCGCRESKVKIINPTGIPMCPRPFLRNSTSSPLLDPNACVLPPYLNVTRLARLSQMSPQGSGVVVFQGGWHRLPSISSIPIILAGRSRGIIGADLTRWQSLATLDHAVLVSTGTSWSAWDSATSLLLPEWDHHRGKVIELEHVPGFDLDVNTYYLGDFSSFLTTAPHSNLTLRVGSWAGGVIGGRSRIYISDNMNVSSNSLKALRYAVTLYVQERGTLQWAGGNLTLSDGSQIIVEGNLDISVTTESVRGLPFIGEGRLLDSSVSASVTGGYGDDPLFGDQIGAVELQPGRNWHGYFDSSLPSELRTGWYNNPICGGKCLVTPQINLRGNGNMTAAQLTDSMFLVPVNMIESSQILLSFGAYSNLYSGGFCGNKAHVQMLKDSILELSSGEMKMQKTCSLVGEGEFLVSAGAHSLPYLIDAHITVSGGAILWPQSRGTDAILTFNGGLLMSSGQMIIEPFSTNVLIHKGVVLTGNCIIQFPMIGRAAQASLSDRQDAPDKSPRGTFNSTSDFTFTGGLLRGKADFNAFYALYLDGDVKRIRSLAKLVNLGHAEWGAGDIILADNADFLNLGTLQMMHGVQNFQGRILYEGTILPTEVGGDVFAELYHSYDTDMGHLSFLNYLKLRTEFVSRAPADWSVEDQLVDESPIIL